MKITAFQKRHLEALVTFRKRKPNLWRFLMFRPLSWIPVLFIFAVSFAFYLLLDEHWGLFMIGMSVGALVRIFAHARFALMAWPVTEEVTDWSKVQALRDENGA